MIDTLFNEHRADGGATAGCAACQRIHGAAMEWVGRFQKEDVRFTAGLELLEFYSAQQDVAGRRPPCKVSCRTCGTPIADEG